MAISVDYVVRETLTNLRRNILMTSAAILTVAVSLSLVGGALLLKQGVSRATIQFRGGVELSVFLRPDASEQQRTAIGTQLKAMPDVKKVTYVDQTAAFEEFKQMFGNRPEFVETVTPQDLPPSFRVVPRQPEAVSSIGARFSKAEGVMNVAYAKDTIDTLLKVTSALQLGIIVVAAVLLLSAALLILNTIRMAIFSRRREVAVMKLVGATNWFIRVPFMLEGMVQGLVGAAAAFAVVAGGFRLIERRVAEYPLIEQFVVSGSDVVGTGIFILVVGATVGAIGSAVAVTRFLDV